MTKALSIEVKEKFAIRNLQWLNEKRKNLVLRYPSKTNSILYKQILKAYRQSKFACDLPNGKGNKWKRVLQSKRLEKFNIDNRKRESNLASFLLEYNK
jgi:hypothetical protein